MDEADRIPIDIGYDLVQPSLGDVMITKSTTRDDGTTVIDILSRPECSTTDEADIVVCAAPESEISEPPPPESLTDRVGNALHTQVGPLELGSISQADGTRRFGARIRF